MIPWHKRSRHAVIAKHLCGVWLLNGSFLVGGAFIVGDAHAEEPTRRFLDRLRDDKLYEIGLKYLEIEEKKGRLPESMKGDLSLERIALMQESLPTIHKADLIEGRMGDIEKELRSFLQGDASHPRRSEAQTRLGDLLRDRAMFATAEGKRPENASKLPELKAKARKWLLDANELYQSIIDELKPTLQSLAGNRAKTPEEIDRRTKLQENYRQAEILQANTLELVADTFDEESAEWKDWLGKADVKLSEIIDKTTTGTEAGRRYLCLLYRGQVLSKLKKINDAREAFTRVASFNEPGVFRKWKAEATAGLIRLDLLESPPKFEAAIQRGDEGVKSLTGQEKLEPYGLALQIALAEARVAYGKTLVESKDGNLFRNNRRDARQILQATLKSPGPHREAATKLLAELGFEQATPEESSTLPDSKNFEEAVTHARSRLDRAENAEQTIPLLQQQSVAAEEIEKIQEDAKNSRLQAIQLYQRALSLYKEADGREALLDSKYLLSYLYLKTDQFWDAYAIASAVLEADKNTDKAAKCGDFALVALSKLIDAAPPEEQSKLIPALEKLAKLLLEIAPGTDGSRNAVDVLIQLAIRGKNFADAERFITMAGGNSGSGASMLGQIQWRDYQERAIEHRKNKTAETAEDQAMLAKAESLLKTAWGNLQAERTDMAGINGANALVSLYLGTGRLDDALQVLNAPAKGTLALVEKSDQIDPKTKLETFRLQLQALVQQAGQPGGKSLVPEEISGLVERMKQISAGDDKLLTTALGNLAYSINANISQATSTDDQARMGSALGVLVRQLVSVTSDVGILDSAGGAVFLLASNLQKVPGLAKQSKELMVIADEAYSKIAAKSADELAAANRKPEEFQIRIAQAKSGAGKYEEANKIFIEALTKSPSLIDFQVAAARNFQEWADGKNIELLQKAWGGSEPTAKGNLIWGWNRISQATATQIKNERFKEIYFDSRYNLALCRRLIGLAEADPEARKRELTQAAGIVRQTKIVYPDFGTPELKAKFERLENDLKNELGGN